MLHSIISNANERLRTQSPSPVTASERRQQAAFPRGRRNQAALQSLHEARRAWLTLQAKWSGGGAATPVRELTEDEEGRRAEYSDEGVEVVFQSGTCMNGGAASTCKMATGGFSMDH